jgi:hypothetical protein
MAPFSRLASISAAPQISKKGLAYFSSLSIVVT